MSSTNKTTNTILSQFIGSDKPSFLTDYNSDMQKIDTAIKSASDLASASDTKATTALSGITDLDNRLDSAETSISTLNPYKAKVDALEDELPLKAPLESPQFTGSVKGIIKTYLMTITNTGWGGTIAPFTKTMSLPDIISTDSPIIDIVQTGNYTNDKTMNDNWSLIYRVVTTNGQITFYSHSIPTANIDVQIGVLR